jgi:hypothetical protein
LPGTPHLCDTKVIASAGHQWFTPVILDTQEAEIKRFEGSKPAWANSLRDAISKKKKKKKPITKKGW